jgi:hypothetical protein
MPTTIGTSKARPDSWRHAGEASRAGTVESCKQSNKELHGAADPVALVRV